ncbi:MAG: hypothetical protein A2284_00030, partial [Deltaproteobacteria bacterium RIFOXYA12_FULL_61_11]
RPGDLRSLVAAWSAYRDCYHPEALRRAFARDLDFDLPKSKLHLVEHQLCHAASSFYTSPYEQADVLTKDQFGEVVSAAYLRGEGTRLTLRKTLPLPTSLGTLYAAVTTFLGFTHHSDEYKIMGLAPYGDPARFRDKLASLVELGRGGTYRTSPLVNNHRHLASLQKNGIAPETVELFERLFGPARLPNASLTDRDRELAAAIQELTERVIAHALEFFASGRSEQLCLAGGVFLNCSANGKLLAHGPYPRIHVQPAANDAGCALGAALYHYHHTLGRPRRTDRPFSVYLGPSFGDDRIEEALGEKRAELRWTRPEDLCAETARLLDAGEIVAWFQGAMEFGPRALGNRSILADPRVAGMKDRINACIKKRESFRPFAPSVTLERAADYFELYGRADSPYMLFAVPVRSRALPAVTHVNGTARVHTVSQEANPIYHRLLTAFGRRTGVPVLLNTSFNTSGEPIVCSPEDALKTFLRTELRYLAVGPFLVEKSSPGA